MSPPNVDRGQRLFDSSCRRLGCGIFFPARVSFNPPGMISKLFPYFSKYGISVRRQKETRHNLPSDSATTDHMPSCSCLQGFIFEGVTLPGLYFGRTYWVLAFEQAGSSVVLVRLTWHYTKICQTGKLCFFASPIWTQRSSWWRTVLLLLLFLLILLSLHGRSAGAVLTSPSVADLNEARERFALPPFSPLFESFVWVREYERIWAGHRILII